MSEKREHFRLLLERIRAILRGEGERDATLRAVCQTLHDAVPYYDWVGFYWVDPDGRDELVLGPFVGEPTEHVRIPFGRGICGQAAARRETFVVPDVSRETNYLSCSPRVRAEIVVPILRGGELIGALDIDSHTLSPFTEEDREFLEEVGRLIAVWL